MGSCVLEFFFSDAGLPLRRFAFEELVYADDLTAYRLFQNHISNDFILDILSRVQSELHVWGMGNQVKFDSSEESLHVLSRHDPLGSDFTLLGIPFDTKLLFNEAIISCTTEAH